MKSLFGVLLAGWMAAQSNPTAVDTYAIYSKIMSAPPVGFGNERYAIAATTRIPMGGNVCIEPPASYSDRWDQVLEDFNARRNAPATLERLLTVSTPYTFITPDEESAFKSVRGGGLPRRTHPETTPAPAPSPKTLGPKFEGVTTIFYLGDVYFSRDRTLALTGIGMWCGGLCGSVQWMIYERLDATWTLVRPSRSCYVDV